MKRSTGACTLFNFRTAEQFFCIFFSFIYVAAFGVTALITCAPVYMHYSLFGVAVYLLGLETPNSLSTITTTGEKKSLPILPAQACEFGLDQCPQNEICVLEGPGSTRSRQGVCKCLPSFQRNSSGLCQPATPSATAAAGNYPGVIAWMTAAICWPDLLLCWFSLALVVPVFWAILGSMIHWHHI